ncbi:hypothetical protein [Nocardia sp. NPDC052566]|uniref:hypothetical protein n=1 Tax=Nocardia sp. NPDC052566 TaxID=3364330 RepID=UPI0037C7AE11
MISNERTAVDAVHATFDRVIAEGLKPDATAAASDEQIDAWAAVQGVSVVPAAVREVLRLMGHGHSVWFAGSAFGLDTVDEETKPDALGALPQLQNAMVDAAGMLVLVDHQAYQYHVIDGADLAQPNPPVWLISEEEMAEAVWPSVTDWFDANAPRVKDQLERFKRMRESGLWVDPARLACYELG